MRLITTVSLFLALASSSIAQDPSPTDAPTSEASTAPDNSGTVLTDKRFEYDNLPYQADTSSGERGVMQGYNQCNSSTETQDSRCATAIVNGIDDFCLWGAPEAGGIIGDVEGEAVAYCSKPGHGTRLIPEGTLTGVQFIRTPDYIQVVGTLDQTGLNIAADDQGGEMDPWGADLRGNPLGGLVFSTAFGEDAEQYEQVVHWTNFMGANQFCIKACDPNGPNGPEHCEHIYDRMGCQYTVIADYSTLEGKFEACESDSALFPGLYVGSDGQTSTYSQPPEGTEPDPPYSPSIPESSSCVTYESISLFTGLPSNTTSA